MVFCPTAGGPCPGRNKCRLWIRGRILYTDSKQIAAQLARFAIDGNESNPRTAITPKVREAFWSQQGIPNIQREIIIDRYLREKVTEVETLAQEWIQSPGFHEATQQEKQEKSKESPEPHTQHCKSPP